MKHEALRQEALLFAEQLSDQYFVRRELDNLSQYMDDNVSWIGSGQYELGRNLMEAKRCLAQELTKYESPFAIIAHQFEAQPQSHTLCLVYGTLHIVPEDSTLSDENIRISVLVEKTSDGMKLVHLHLSHPDSALDDGHLYAPKALRGDAKALRLALDARGRQLENLIRNIPGGAHQCKNDPNLTLLSMSDGFLTMFGYTREEVKKRFNDQFLEMVYPGDRAGLLKNANEQLQTGNAIELEYRVMHKNGSPIWILDKARLIEDGQGGTCFYCLLIEITDRKKAQEELRLSLERHQVIMDQATDIIFEWDICADKLSFSPNWKKKFGYNPIDNRISGQIPLSQNIHPDDIPAFVKIMQDTAAGVPYSETEFRIKDKSEQYLWCRIRATAQFDSEHRAIKAVGVIVDIDGEKKEKQALWDMAQKDALTGLYNKNAVSALVQRRMESLGCSTVHALLILDVDFFKEVNDTYGHLCGDSLLSNVAATLQSRVRSTDLVGRIGGDEFLIYLPEVKNEAAALRKAEKLLEALTQLTPENGAPPITCSIGIVVAPCGDEDYETLYKNADLALYHRKNNGRGGVTVYNMGFCGSSPMESRSTVMDSEIEGGRVDNHMSQYCFRALYSAKDTESAIQRLLEIIGRSYDVSRTYIFEDSDDGLLCSNTFEWCADNVKPQITELQNLSYIDDLDDYKKNFDENGLFYLADVRDTPPNLRSVLEPQGIRSMLQCAILDEGKFVGYIGFDECRNYRAWGSKQVDAFKITADVLSTFLVRLRQKQKLKSGQAQGLTVPEQRS